MARNITTVNDLNQPMIHELMRVIMEAHYLDAINAQIAFDNGTTPSIQTNAQTFQQSVVGLVIAVGEAMRNGELTPFHGNYVEWLVNRGFIDKPQQLNEAKNG